MKTKVIILLAASALITLSFTFVTVRGKEAPQAAVKTEINTSAAEASAPAGGFTMADQAF
ncbi:hypothetical protein KK062_25385 [Fulvivirgaceae bacterium PWU5]|uniref:Uncharacterized protein n=1 Tax=Dawidia cretensis TaxID=2782350 RepID=A0AAP2E4H3_9BACT|nr:hypothetical protein [Dawidia cretensis]MBT1711602.1 hypothetical protein [Dawidia cretensis]